MRNPLRSVLTPSLGFWLAMAATPVMPGCDRCSGKGGVLVVPGVATFVFDSSPTGAQFDVWVMGVDGSNPTPLTSGPGSNYDPSLSRDGTRVAFSSTRDGNSEIYVMNANGTGQTRLTNNAASDDRPSFNFDGTRIAFVSTRDGNPEIYVMNVDGTNQVRITNNGAQDLQPQYGWTSNVIVFYTNRDGNNEIYTMNDDGTGVTRWTNDAADDVEPTWRPDGARVAFASSRVGGGDYELYTVDVPLGAATRRTFVAPAGTGCFDPGYDPSGENLFFTSDRDGTFDVFRKDEDDAGAAHVNLGPAATYDGSPSFGP